MELKLTLKDLVSGFIILALVIVIILTNIRLSKLVYQNQVQTNSQNIRQLATAVTKLQQEQANVGN